MDPKDAFKFLQFISTWEPQIDVVALKYYVTFTATSAALCGSSINKYFRRAVKLRGQGFISSFLPIVVLPAIVGSIFHSIFVIEPLLTEAERKCSICLELRSGCIAVLSGVLYPGLLAPVSAFVNAERYFTYALPPIQKEPLVCLKEAARIYRPFLPKIGFLALVQMIGGMALLYYEEKNYLTVKDKTLKMEAYLLDKRKEKEKL